MRSIYTCDETRWHRDDVHQAEENVCRETCFYVLFYSNKKEKKRERKLDMQVTHKRTLRTEKDEIHQ